MLSPGLCGFLLGTPVSTVQRHVDYVNRVNSFSFSVNCYNHASQQNNKTGHISDADFLSDVQT